VDLFVTRGGKNYGPYSEAQVREMIQRGELSRGDLAWCNGQPDWTPLAEILTFEDPPPLPRGGQVNEDVEEGLSAEQGNEQDGETDAALDLFQKARLTASGLFIPARVGFPVLAKVELVKWDFFMTIAIVKAGIVVGAFKRELEARETAFDSLISHLSDWHQVAPVALSDCSDFLVVSRQGLDLDELDGDASRKELSAFASVLGRWLFSSLMGTPAETGLKEDHELVNYLGETALTAARGVIDDGRMEVGSEADQRGTR